MNILITGPPGCGKTTLITKICSSFRHLQPVGFYTEEVRDIDTARRVGFDIVTLDGKRIPLARVDRSRGKHGPSVGKYRVDVSAFERLVIPILREAETSSLAVIDEIGKMELFSREFQAQVRKLLDSAATVVLGTIPCPRDGRERTGIAFVDMIRACDKDGRTQIWTIQLPCSTQKMTAAAERDNRDAIFEEISYILSLHTTIAAQQDRSVFLEEEKEQKEEGEEHQKHC